MHEAVDAVVQESAGGAGHGAGGEGAGSSHGAGPQHQVRAADARVSTGHTSSFLLSIPDTHHPPCHSSPSLLLSLFSPSILAILPSLSFNQSVITMIVITSCVLYN